MKSCKNCANLKTSWQLFSSDIFGQAVQEMRNKVPVWTIPRPWVGAAFKQLDSLLFKTTRPLVIRAICGPGVRVWLLKCCRANNPEHWTRWHLSPSFPLSASVRIIMDHILQLRAGGIKPTLHSLGIRNQLTRTNSYRSAYLCSAVGSGGRRTRSKHH